MAPATPAPRPAAVDMNANGAQSGLGRRRILLIIGALMLGMLLAAVVAGVFRFSLSFWAASGGTVPPGQVVDLAFRALADGLPERCALRDVITNENRRDDH